MIDAHVYSLPQEMRRESALIPETEAAVLRAIHRHPESPYALSLSSPSAILSSMDEAGIKASVLVSLPWRSQELCRRNNDHVLALANDSGRFYAICSIQCASPDWEIEAERVCKSGAVGLKINTAWQGGSLDAPEVRALAECVREHDVFLMTHVDHAFKHSSTGPAALFELARKCLDTKIVAAHLGGLLGLYVLHPPVARCLKNVWFDTAVSGTLEMVRFYCAAGIGEKLLFGSDFPFNHSHSQLQVLMELVQLGLEEPVMEGILEDNFKNLAMRRGKGGS